MSEIKARAAAVVEEEGGDEMAMRRAVARLIEEELNHWHGDCWLRDEEVARVVVAVLQSGHGRKYTLRAWSLLPNHVQVVFSVAEGVDAGAVVREWRSVTTRQVNLLVGREAEDLWERMPYLKPCLDDAEVLKRVRGVEFRPVNGGLCRRPRDWKWGSARQTTPPTQASVGPAAPSPGKAEGTRSEASARPGTGKSPRPSAPSGKDEPDEDPFA